MPLKKLFLIACVAFPLAILLLLHLHLMQANTGLLSIGYIGLMCLDVGIALLAAVKLVGATFFSTPTGEDEIGVADLDMADRWFYPLFVGYLALILALNVHRAAVTTGWQSYFASIWLIGAVVLLLPSLVLASKAVQRHLRSSVQEPAQVAVRKS